MGQKEIFSHLSSNTCQLLERLFHLERRYPRGYAPVRELKPLLMQKNFYVDDYQNRGGRETNRTFLRLLSGSLEDYDGRHPDMQCLNIDDVRNVFIRLDGFYGLGLGTLHHLLQFSDIAACVSEIRAHPHGEREPLFPYRQEPMLQHYVFDPACGRSLVVEVTRRHRDIPFGMFLFHADRITHREGEGGLQYCVKDLARIFRRPDFSIYRLARKESSSTVPDEPAPRESLTLADTLWFV